jgi:Ca-activated chloride channel family protein
VVLHAIVVDPQNHLISDLNRDAFNVFENGKQQRMTSFRHENVPLALGILIDNSGSMRPKRQKVNEAALNLVRSSNVQDEVFVVNFGEEYYLDQDFTGDVAKLKAALDMVQSSGSTALYDAIVASAAHIRRDARIQKRVLLVVTDGRDNASQESLDETLQQLQQADGPVVYVIAFVDETKGASSTIRALQAISFNTGGTAYFPKDLGQVDAITKSIGYDIRDQYVIGYKSSNPMAGHAYHAIEVQANDGDRHKLRVRTRTGYYSEETAASR